MDIKKVELLQPVASEPESAAMIVQFYVKENDGNKIYVPLDPTNRHYAEVAAWYKAQDKKPFEFDFKHPEKTVEAVNKLRAELKKQAAKAE